MSEMARLRKGLGLSLMATWKEIHEVVQGMHYVNMTEKNELEALRAVRNAASDVSDAWMFHENTVNEENWAQLIGRLSTALAACPSPSSSGDGKKEEGA